MRPKIRQSAVLTAEEEAIGIAFRESTLLPLDDCLFSLQETIPSLSIYSLQKLFQRNEISGLPQPENRQKRKKFKA
jgi:hypothetical protein